MTLLSQLTKGRLVVPCTRSLARHQHLFVSYFCPPLLPHYGRMKIAIIRAAHHPDADGKRRNLYGSLMSTERRRCHLIRDLIAIIMKKYTRLLHGTLS